MKPEAEPARARCHRAAARGNERRRCTRMHCTLQRSGRVRPPGPPRRQVHWCNATPGYAWLRHSEAHITLPAPNLRRILAAVWVPLRQSSPAVCLSIYCHRRRGNRMVDGAVALVAQRTETVSSSCVRAPTLAANPANESFAFPAQPPPACPLPAFHAIGEPRWRRIRPDATPSRHAVTPHSIS